VVRLDGSSGRDVMVVMVEESPTAVTAVVPCASPGADSLSPVKTSGGDIPCPSWHFSSSNCREYIRNESDSLIFTGQLLFLFRSLPLVFNTVVVPVA
jgi:hypothetical protein